MVKWSGTWARSEALSSFPSLSVQQAMQSWVGPGNDASGNIHLTELYCAVLSWASAHGCSQLNQQKLEVGGYTEEVLEWFDCPHANAHLRCEVSCQGVLNQPASWLRPCFIKSSPMVEQALLC